MSALPLGHAKASLSTTPLKSVFIQPAFRQLIAREFRLQTIEIHLEWQGLQLTIPAFLKKNTWQTDTLIIGAGFDKTGTVIGLSAKDYPAFIQHLLHHLRDSTIGLVEWRTVHPLPCQLNYADKVELVMNLDQLSCATRWQQFSQSTRRNLRQAAKQGFHYEIGQHDSLVNAFYPLYQQHLHQLGSLPHERGFFTDLLSQCREHCSLFIGYWQDRPVVASFDLVNSEEMYGAWLGIDPAYKKHNLLLNMLWQLAEYNEQNRRQRYNLGRSSKDSGAFQFKQRFADEIRELYYYRLPVPHSSSKPSAIHNSAAWLIRHTPPLVMNTLSRHLLHRFY